MNRLFFGLLFLAIGSALCAYGMNKSREIGGWAGLIVAVSALCFWFAFDFL